MDTDKRFRGPLHRSWNGYAPERLADLLLPPEAALPVAPATDRAIWASSAQLTDRVTIDDVRRRATPDLGTPWPQTPASSYARYWRDGDRDAYEQMVFARQHRLTRAAVVAAHTLDDRWLDEVADGVTMLCEQSSWCWPAHDDTNRVHGAVVPTVTDPYVDLGAGEVVGQLAWLDQLLAAPLENRVPGLRARMRHEARIRVLEPFVRRRDWHWLGLDGDVHNWNPWIHGNVLVAALRLVEDRRERAALVALVIEGLDRYVAALPADGAIDEGYTYWWNGACRALEALDLLAYATQGALDVTDVPSLRATVGFPHRMHLGGHWYVNFADGPARVPATQPWHAVHRAAVRVGDHDARRHAAAHRRPGEPAATEHEGLGRLLRALTDSAWVGARPDGVPLPRESWFPSTQVLVARQAEGRTRGLALAVKGGHNGEHHNHNDVGNVVVALDGVPVLVDAGRPTYTAQTFGPDRYTIWTMQSNWHNVPAIRGIPQSQGRQYAARDVEVQLGEGAARVRLDLAAAYPRDDVRRWWRVAELDRESGRITLSDAWELDEDSTAPGSVSTFLLAGEIDPRADEVLVTPLGGTRTLSLRWDPAAPSEVELRRLDDPLLRDVWGDALTRLRIHLPATTAGSSTIRMEVAR